MYLYILRITGISSRKLCEPFISPSFLYTEYGCDALLCKPGSFAVRGHATPESGCRDCPASNESIEHERNIKHNNRIFGRTNCDNRIIVRGDWNGDGILTESEILRLFFFRTEGKYWGPSFQDWVKVSTLHECDLKGITCVDGEITQLDLTDAKLCSNGNQQESPRNTCSGIPTEIGLLTSLEHIYLNHQPFLRGSIPTEIGNLVQLHYLDFSDNLLLGGPLPSELGNLTNLRSLDLSNCQLTGTIPSYIFHLPYLEHLHLSRNRLTGTIPKQIGTSKKLRQLLISRNLLTGTLPTQIGRMAQLENFEVYINSFTGSIPAELALPTIKRIGKYNLYIHI